MESLGLSDIEKKIFDCLIRQKMFRNATRIAKDCGMPRMTVVDILKRLETRKLARNSSKGERKVWGYWSGLENKKYTKIIHRYSENHDDAILEKVFTQMGERENSFGAKEHSSQARVHSSASLLPNDGNPVTTDGKPVTSPK